MVTNQTELVWHTLSIKSPTTKMALVQENEILDSSDVMSLGNTVQSTFITTVFKDIYPMPDDVFNNGESIF